MFALSLTVCEKKANTLIDSEDQSEKVEERDLRHATGNVRIHVGDFFFRILAVWEHNITQKVIHGQTHSERQAY